MKVLRSILMMLLIMAWVTPVFGAAVQCSKEATTDGPFHPGETINYDILYTNINSFTLTVTRATDDPPTGPDVPLTDGPALPTQLAPAGSLQWGYAYTLPTDANPGFVTNRAIVQGYRTNLEADVANCDISTTDEVVVPCVKVVKTVEPALSKAGDEVEFTITVTNCGAPAISAVSVIDTLMGDITSQFIATLAQGQSESYSYMYMVQETDPDPLVNEVDVEYVDEFDAAEAFTVTDDNATEVDLVHPEFTIDVSCLTVEPAPGDSVLFDVVFENIGDIDLLLATNLAPPNDSFTLAPQETKTVSISEILGEDDLTICVNATATLPTTDLLNVIGPVENCGTCTPEMEGGATRTLGYWKNHCEYTRHVFEVHCGGEIDLGWTTVTTIEDVLGILFSNPGQQSNGKRPKGLCKDRAMPTIQALVALLNNCLNNGAPLPEGYSPAEIAEILGGTDKDDIKMLGGILDDYNNSGDDEAIIDSHGFMFSSATPQDCRAQADLSAADCP